MRKKVLKEPGKAPNIGPFGARGISKPRDGGSVVGETDDPMAPSGKARGVVGEELSQGYPEFDENGQEFQDVDVMKQGIDDDLAVLGIGKSGRLREAAADEVKDSETPHVIQLVGVTPASEAVGTGVGGKSDTGVARNDEPDGPGPARSVAVVRDGRLQGLEFGDDVIWNENKAALIPAAEVVGAGSRSYEIVEQELQAEGAVEATGTDNGGVAEKADDA